MRRIPLSRRSHVIGFRPLPTGTAEHESVLERDFVILSTFLDPDAAITSQPITIAFQVGAVTRRYTPDYFVAWSDGRREIVEVKYLSDLRANQERFKERFAAMEDWTRARGGPPSVSQRSARFEAVHWRTPSGYCRCGPPRLIRILHSRWYQLSDGSWLPLLPML